MASRTSFFAGMRPSAWDMTNSQIALNLGMKYRVSDYFSEGVVDGLTVYDDSGYSGHVAVGSGTAYRSDGERIDISSVQRNIGYNNVAMNASAGTYTVVARYTEGNDGITGIDLDGSSHFTHLTDSYTLNVLKSGTDTILSTDVRLTDVIVTVDGGTFIYDTTQRDTSECQVGASSDSGSVASHGYTHLQDAADFIPYSFRMVTSGNPILTASDNYVILNQSGDDLTLVTLPDTPRVGAKYTIKDGKGTANTAPITVVPPSGTIDGATAFFVDVEYGSIDALFDGSNYLVV